MKEYLFANGGPTQVGIFRIAPDQEENARVKDELNKGTFVSCRDVNCISNLIKVFFRELPEKILDGVDPKALGACYTESDAAKLMNLLLPASRAVFSWLLDLCVDITALEKTNKMTPQNLAIVFAPNMFNPDSIPDPMLVRRLGIQDDRLWLRVSIGPARLCVWEHLHTLSLNV